MTSRLESYAQWLVDNQDKQSTPEFQTVAQAYKALRFSGGEEPTDNTQRTWGEAAKDVGAGLVSGVGSLLQVPGQLYGLATGDFSKTGLLGAGEAVQKYGEEMKSEGLKAREEARTAKVQEAEKEGQLSALTTALGQTIKDPALLTSFLAEQAPQLIPMILTGGGAAALASKNVMSAAAARGAATAAAEKLAAKKALEAGTTAAIQTGAVMQGADIGSGTYDEIYKGLREKGLSEKEAADETINKARLAGIAGYGLSVLANRYVPGSSAIERIMAGEKLGGSRLATAALTGLKEIPGENIEEVGGRIAQNIAARQAGLDRDILSGTGETAAMATLGAAGMGGGAGLVAGRAAPSVVPTPEAEEPTAQTPETPAAPPAAPPVSEPAETLSTTETPSTEPVSPEIQAMQEEYDKRETEIQDMEARRSELNGREKGLLIGKQKKNRELKKKIDDARTKEIVEGEEVVARPDEQTGGAGVTVPPQPANELSATQGTRALEPNGMVPAGQNVVQPAQREGKQLAPIATPQAPAEPIAKTEPAPEPVAKTQPTTNAGELGKAKAVLTVMEDAGAPEPVLEKQRQKISDLSGGTPTEPIPNVQAAPAPVPTPIVKREPQAPAVPAPSAEELATREATPEEEAAIEADPLLENAVMDVQQGVPVAEFASTNDIPLDRAQVLYDEAKRVLDNEGIPYTDHDEEILAREAPVEEEEQPAVSTPETGGTMAGVPKRAKGKKGNITAQGRETRTGRPSIMGNKPTPPHVQREMNAGNSRAVLNMLRTAAPNPVHRAIAQHLYKAGLFPKINLVQSLPDGRVAQYNPKTRTIDATEKAMRDPGQVLHEYIHDATIKVLYKFLNGEKLTPTQQRAAQHLQFLMNESGGAVINPTTGQTYKEAFPNAYENLYEFVSYGLTNEEFAKALSKLRIPQDQVYNRTASAFRRFVEAVARLIGFTDEEINTLSQKLGIAQEDVTQKQLIKEYGDPFERAGFQTNTMNTGVFAAFLDVVAPPAAAGYELPTMAVQQVKQAENTPSDVVNTALKQVKLKEHGTRKKISNLFTKRGATWLTEHFQNDRYRLKRWEDRLSLLDRIDRITDKLNNVYGQITRSAGIGVDMFNTHMKAATEDAQKAVKAYADKLGVDLETALERLHLILEARHEPERRRVKFIMRVPLDNMAQSIKIQDMFTDPGVQALFDRSTYHPEGFREAILKALSSKMNKMPEAQRKQYAGEMRAALDKVVDNKANHAVIVKTTSAKGKTTERKTTAADFDQNSEIYNVIGGRTPADIAEITKILDRASEKKEIDAVAQALAKVSKQSIELNKFANYFSVPTQNIVDFYGFNNYVPFKGLPGREQIDEEFDIGSRRIGGELQDGQDRFEGRVTESENPVLQMLADGASSALRAGRKDLTLAIKNAVEQKLMPGKKVATISFEDRYLGNVDKENMVGTDKIFHYNNDGTIDIIQIGDKQLSEAIRRQYRESSPVIDLVNRITSGIGMMHTRYNPAFAPMNFVRDALTNAFTLGAEFGPAKAGRLLTQISSDVASGGMGKSLRYAVLYSRGDFKAIEELAKKDPYYRDLQEYVKKGGMVEYLEGVAAKGALDKLIQDVGFEKMGPHKIATLLKKKDIDNFLDIYNRMFELSSRVATFRVMRENVIEENKAKGMSEDKARQDATIQAIEYAKNLANFEQVGKWGKEAGALFMFFRPAATGAVRALEALAPAFTRFDEKEFRLEAKQSGATDAQIDRAVKTIKGRKASARRMAAALAGMGMVIYWMAVMMSGDDDDGRNMVLNDDMARWTRYARFHIPGTEMYFQIPWGFGLGAFASFGAQAAAVLSGRSTVADAIGNSVPTALDSFLPLPVSRISPLENLPAFMIDSALPSAVRPFVEYMMNLDGLGREIYNNRQTRYGDAYTGGDNIPETYKSAARTIFNMTDGQIDISPNTMYFFASNYVDGIAKTFTGAANAGMTAMGYKDADLRNDVPPLASFFGGKSNVDSREFSKAEKKIQQMEKRINSLKDKPDMLARYMGEHAQEFMLVEYYNNAVNGTLRQLRQSANQLRANPDMTPKERKAQLDVIIKLQNFVKRDILNGINAIGGVD